MANIITELHLEMSDNWYVSKKLNSVGRVGENTVTKLIIEPTEILDNVTYEIEIADASGSKNVAELTIDGTELYLILTANMLTTSGIMKMQVRGLFTDGSIKKSNIFELKVNRSISATEHYEEYAVTIFDQLVQDCRDIIEGAESYAVRAETAAVNAEAYEQSASASAEAASASEATATSASTAAVNAAASAESASAAAHTSAETATTAANSASASASTAQTSAQTATSASVTAQSASETAVSASTTATTAANSAESSATSASTSANNASASATSAASSAANAATSETNASASATSAATSATSAANSATSASTSATNAANSATSAATSATNAHNSEVNASTSETNASTSATEAAASAESIAASAAQINENTYRINDLEAIIAGYQQADLPTGAIASVTDGTALLMPSLKVGIEPVQEGSGDPSPENIRPISGWTETNATRTGKNLCEDTLYAGAGYNLAVGTIITPIETTTLVQIDGDTFIYDITSWNGLLFKTKPLRAGRYKLHFDISAITNPRCSVYQFGADGTVKSMSNYASGSDVDSARITEDGDTLSVWIGSTTVQTIRVGKPQIELGSEATTYEPYNGQTYSIEFKDGDNPLTVYGGTLDVTSGELIVDRVKRTLSVNDTYTKLGNTTVYMDNWMDIFKPTNPELGLLYCSHYKESLSTSLTDGCIAKPVNNRAIIFNDSIHATSVNDFKTYVAEQINNNTPIEVVYKLESPITYHLTPTQVRTLVGNNNIWADTGDIIEGSYFKSLT